MDTDPIQILIADDHTLFAEALSLMLRTDPRMEVVGVALNGREAVDLAAALRPDVVLMDLHMPVMDGIEATRQLRRASPSSRVVVVTASTSAEDSDRARAAGAVAYIRKWSTADELQRAVVDAVRDERPFRSAWAMTPRLLRSA